MSYSIRSDRNETNMGPMQKGSPNVVDRLYKQMVALADGHGENEQ